MRVTYIPRWRTVTYDAIDTDLLIVRGRLTVKRNINARSIIGEGAILAENVTAGTIRIRRLTASNICCARLTARSVYAGEVSAYKSATVFGIFRARKVTAPRLNARTGDIVFIESGEGSAA